MTVGLAHFVVASDIILCEPPILTEICYCRDIVVNIQKGMSTGSLEGRNGQRFWFLYRQSMMKEKVETELTSM